MVDEQVAAVLERFRLEYDELIALRRRVDARLAQVHAAITALAATDNRKPLKFEGSLSDACRTILKGAMKPMAPTEVRDGIVGIGFQLSSLSHGNPMASVHSVLKRFVDSGDAESVQTKDGTKYRWTGRAETERAITALSPLMDYTGVSGTLGDLMKQVKSPAMRALMDDAAKATASLGPTLKAIAPSIEALRRESAKHLGSETGRKAALPVKPKNEK